MKYRNALTLLGFLLVLGGCASLRTANPVATAKNPETVALALYGGYVIAEESAADLAAIPSTPDEVKTALRDADIKAALVAEKLEPLAKQVGEVRAEIAAGGGSQTLLLTVIAHLNDWVNEFAPLMKDLTDTIKEAKSP